MATAENSDFDYDAFASYATDPDRDLVREVEAIVEGLHRRPTLPEEFRQPLELCVDGRDFSIPRRSGAADASFSDIEDIVTSYQRRARSLLVFSGPLSREHPWLDREIRWWLKNRPDAPVYFALTHGMTPDQATAPPALVERRGGDLPVFFDLRGFYLQLGIRARLTARFGSSTRRDEIWRDARRWQSVRPFQEEALRLVARLLSDLLQREYTVDDIQKAWDLDERRARWRRNALLSIGGIVLAAAGAAVKIATDKAVAAQGRERAEAWLEQSKNHLDRGGPALPTAAAYVGSLLHQRRDASAIRAALDVSASLVPVERILRPDGGQPAWTADFIDADRLLAIGGQDGIVRIVDVQTGEIRALFNVHARPIRVFAADRTQKVLWVGTSQGLARLSWREDTGAFELHDTGRALEHDRIDALALDPVRQRLLAGVTFDGKLWSFPLSPNAPLEGQEEAWITDERFVDEDGASRAPSRIDFLAVRGNQIISVAINGVVTVLAADHPKTPLRQFVHSRGAFGAAVDSTGTRVVIADSSGSVAIYDLASKAMLVAEQLPAHPGDVAPSLQGRLVSAPVEKDASVGVAIDQEDRIVGVTSHDRTVRFLSLDSLAPLGVAVHRETTWGVAFGHDRALTFGDDGAIQVVHPFGSPEDCRIAAVAGFAVGKGSRIAVWPATPAHAVGGGTKSPPKQDRPIFTLDVSRGCEQSAFGADEDPVDGLFVDDMTLAVRRVMSTHVPLVRHGASVAGVCNTLDHLNEPGNVEIVQSLSAGPLPDSLATLVTHGSTPSVRIWSMKTCLAVQTYATRWPWSVAENAIATTPEERMVAIRRPSDWSPALLAFDRPVRAVAVGPDGAAVLASLDGPQAVCLCSPPGTAAPRATSSCHVDSLAYACDTVSDVLPGNRVSAMPAGLWFSPSGNLALAVHGDGVFLLRKAARWRSLRVGEGALNMRTLPHAFSSDEQFLALPGPSRDIVIVNTSTGAAVAALPVSGSVTRLAFVNDGSHRLVSLDSEVFRVWTWDPDLIRDRLCQRWSEEAPIEIVPGVPAPLSRVEICGGKGE